MRRTSLLSLAAIILSNLLMAQNYAPPQEIVPIPGPQAYSTPTPVDAIVTDSQGNLIEQTYTYYPNYYPQDADHPVTNVVIINNTQQVTTNGCAVTCPSIFFPLFSLGFLFSGGYWCGYDGYYWNGFNFISIGYGRYWGPYWRNYWNRDWNRRWQNHWDGHHRDGNWRYHQNRSWSDHSGRAWRQSGGGHGAARQGGAQHRGGAAPRGGGGGHGSGHGGGDRGGGHRR